MANGTHFPTGSSGEYSVPAVGVGEYVTLGAWVYLPGDPEDYAELILGDGSMSVFSLYYQVGYGGWMVLQSYSSVAGTTGGSGGWVYFAVVISRASLVAYWRRAECQDMGRSAAVDYSYDGAAFTGKLGAFGGFAQYVGVWQVELTEAQILAQSQSTTPIESAYSWFPLNENSGTGTIGGRNMALSSTATAPAAAPAATLPTPRSEKATLLDRAGYNYAIIPYSPFAASYTITVSAWIKVGLGEKNSYVVHFTDGSEEIVFVVQHTVADPTTLATNLMSNTAGDWATCYETRTQAECEGWVFVAWVVTSTGSTRAVTHYRQYGVDGTLAQGTVNLSSTTETGWNSSMNVEVGIASAYQNEFAIQHLRIHTSALNSTQLAALAVAETPDTTAWTHVTFSDTSPLDVSGNAHHASLVSEAWAAAGPWGMPDVDYIGAGTLTGNAAGISPPLPAGIVAGDMLYLLLATANQAISIANANGGTWTEETGSPQGTGTAGGTSAVRLTVFRSVYNGTQGAPTTSDSGDHQLGQIVAYRGQAATDPVNITSSGVEATSDTSWSIAGATTTADECRVIVIGARMNDSAEAHFGYWTNSDLTGLTERVDAGSTAGNGSGFGIADGLKATAGAYGATTVTNSTATVKAFMTIALKPEPAAAEGDIAGTSAGTSTVSGALSGLASASGTSAGTVSLVGGLSGWVTAAGTSSGTSSQSGALSGRASAAGASAGTSTVSGTASGLSSASASSAGTSTVVGSLTGLAALAGSSAGASTVSGDLSTSATVALSGTSAGTSTETGALAGVASLAGTSAGSASVSASLSGRSQVAGTSAGTSTNAGALAGLASVVGSSAGTSSASGSLRSFSSLAANDAGTSTLSGAIRGFATMAGVAAGVAVATGSLSLSLADSLSGTSSGSSVASGALSGVSTLAGDAPGTSSLSGAISGRASAAGTSAGTSTSSGDLSTLTGAAIAGASAGTSTASGELSGLATVAGQSSGTGATVGALSGWCSVVATAGGASSVTGAASLLSVLSGTAEGSSESEGALLLGSPMAGASNGTSAASGALLGSSSLSGSSHGSSSQTGTLSAIGSVIATGGSVSLTFLQPSATLTITDAGSVTLTIS